MSAMSQPTVDGEDMIYMFFDRLLHRAASPTMQALDTESAWCSLWLAAVRTGNQWGPSEYQPVVRVGLCTELRRDLDFPADGSRLPGGLVLRIAPADVVSEALLVNRRVFADAVGLWPVDAETAWALLWGVAVSRGAAFVEGDERLIRFAIASS